MTNLSESVISDIQTRYGWELVKRLEGGARDDWLYWQAYERGLGCFFCKKAVLVVDFDVHHLDKAYVPLNARENTRLAHHSCNSARERESSVLMSGQPHRTASSLRESAPAIATPTSKELEIAMQLKPWWRKEVEDIILKHGKCSDQWAVFGLAGKAFDLFGYGSSKTLGPYLKEFVAYGLWELRDHYITLAPKGARNT